MRRALVTFAVGEHEQLLELSLPRFQEYATRHGYDLLIPTSVAPCDRPPSWWKVPMLRQALSEYGEVLWLDADIAITDRGLEQDIAETFPRDCWQALVAHHTPDGEVPNLGVWFVRRPMLHQLDQMWSATRYVNHPWWEQAAMLDLLGYQHDPRPCRHTRPTQLHERTAFLPLEWNSHEQNDRHDDPRFAHVTPNSVQWRLPIMRNYLAPDVAYHPV